MRLSGAGDCSGVVAVFVDDLCEHEDGQADVGGALLAIADILQLIVAAARELRPA